MGNGLWNYVADFLGWVWPTPGIFGLNQGFTQGVHNGVDIDVDLNTPIYAPIAGQAEAIISDTGYGNHVRITAPNGITVILAHLNELGWSGTKAVQPGELVGTSGSTGNSTGPHLHYEVRYQNSPINPFNDIWYWFDSPSSAPPGGPTMPGGGVNQPPSPGGEPGSGYNPGSGNYPTTRPTGITGLPSIAQISAGLTDAGLRVGLFIAGFMFIGVAIGMLTGEEILKNVGQEVVSATQELT